MSTRDKLKEIIRELIRQELEEVSVTGSIDGGAGPPKTPYAFSGGRKKDKEKKKKITQAGGYTKVHEAHDFYITYRKKDHNATLLIKANDFKDASKKALRKLKSKEEKAIISISQDVKNKQSFFIEGKYHDYRNDDTLSPKQKIGRSMREIRDSLNNLDKLVKMNVRLKNELNVDSRSYWKNTHKALNKISERLVKLANKVGQLQ